MASSGSSFNYFPQNQLAKFSAHSLNDKGKRSRRNKFKSAGRNNLPAKRAEIKTELLYAKLSQ